MKTGILKRILRPFRNIYILIIVVFSIWMLFFDTHSWFLHNELNNDIKDLEAERDYYKSEIEKDKSEISELKSKEGLEKYGREEYKMKRNDEDIYIIEYEDSLKKQKRDE